MTIQIICYIHLMLLIGTVAHGLLYFYDLIFKRELQDDGTIRGVASTQIGSELVTLGSKELERTQDREDINAMNGRSELV